SPLIAGWSLDLPVLHAIGSPEACLGGAGGMCWYNGLVGDDCAALPQENPIMNAEWVLRMLDEHREELRRLGVRRLGLFGSAARNEATDASDLDFLVEFQQKSFDAYMDLKALLEVVFERRVDLVLAETLKPRLRARIVKDVLDYATGL